MTIGRYSIIDSTLREGEQFATASFTRAQKLAIARSLDEFGVEYLELTSPLASPQSHADCLAIAGLGLRAKLLAHIRCHMEDARRVVDAGVRGANLVIGTSPQLREFSHGKAIGEIVDLAVRVVEFLLRQGLEVRFSTEDSFRSVRADLFAVYEAVDAVGVDRVGVADTVGVGTPAEVHSLVAELRRRVRADVEFHGHNDTGCAVANAFAALEAGATHIDTTVLGVGERNGITPLGGLVARLYSIDPSLVGRYDLARLREIDELVASALGLEIPFNNYITGSAAFSHKAGIHTKAVLNSPSTYEVLRPEAFGVSRQIHIAHRLTGWNALRHRAEQLGLALDESQLRAAARTVKSRADVGPLSAAEVDELLADYAGGREARPHAANDR